VATLGLRAGALRHSELATPRGFCPLAGRPFVFVGGLASDGPPSAPSPGQPLPPLPGFWLCGDGIPPGRGHRRREPSRRCGLPATAAGGPQPGAGLMRKLGP